MLSASPSPFSCPLPEETRDTSNINAYLKILASAVVFVVCFALSAKDSFALNLVFDPGLDNPGAIPAPPQYQWASLGTTQVNDIANPGNASFYFDSSCSLGQCGLAMQLVDLQNSGIGGFYQFEFDFLNGLSDTPGPLGTDVFFASLYAPGSEVDYLDFLDSLTNAVSFDLTRILPTSFDPAVLDLMPGSSNSFQTLEPSLLGGDWWHLTMQFEVLDGQSYVIPVFEFYDQNGETLELSFVGLDNITISALDTQPIPEPTTLSLISLSSLIFCRKRKKHIESSPVS